MSRRYDKKKRRQRAKTEEARERENAREREMENLALDAITEVSETARILYGMHDRDRANTELGQLVLAAFTRCRQDLQKTLADIRARGLV